MSTFNCAPLLARTNFDQYVRLLPKNQDGTLNQTLLELCKPEICSALWGDGNPDISGVGMIVGYFLQQALGLVLVLGILTTSYGTCKPSTINSWQRALASFNDCSMFFAFSIQVAAIVVLAREDFGVSTSNMGDATVRIIQAVSVLVLLPLVYPSIMPLVQKPPDSDAESHGDSEQHDGGGEKAENTSDPDAAAKRRFYLFVACWLPSLYPFYSKMNAVFGPSQIGRSGGISVPAFEEVQNMCSTGVRQISNTENSLMVAFEVMAFIPLSLAILGNILMIGARKHHSGSRLVRAVDARKQKLGTLMKQRAGTIVLLVVPLLSSSLLWTIVRVWEFQQEMAANTAGDDTDTLWTFGQVVAVTVFLPVATDFWFRCD